jgi:ribosomal protein S18 acetylase RimI-like enzyme
MLARMIIRTAGRSDARALSELAIATYSDAFGHSFSAADLAAHLRENLSEACFERFLDADVFLLAAVDDRVVGYVQFGAASLPVGTASKTDQELRRLYVHTDFQGQGIGTSLIAAALDHPQLKGARNIYLDVWERNDGAQGFYRRYGFEAIGARDFAVASGAATDRDVIMVRRSSP